MKRHHAEFADKSQMDPKKTSVIMLCRGEQIQNKDGAFLPSALETPGRGTCGHVRRLSSTPVTARESGKHAAGEDRWLNLRPTTCPGIFCADNTRALQQFIKLISH